MSRNDEKRDAFFCGWRAAKNGIQDPADILLIHFENCRYVNAWTSENNSGKSNPRLQKAQAGAIARAEAIAARQGWQLDMSGGLWWSLVERSKAENLLSGL